MMDLKTFNNSNFDRGASKLKELMWRIIQQFFFNFDFLKIYSFKRSVLKAFGAELGEGMEVKPHVRITFPWKLKMGSMSWIGEEAWLLNLDHIEIGSNVVISQRVFLCTGSHDWKKQSFDLMTKPIVVGDGVWICADVFVGPGVTIGDGCVVTAGSVVNRNLPPGMICSGNPCVPIKPRY